MRSSISLATASMKLAQPDGTTFQLHEFIDVVAQHKEDGEKDLDRIVGRAKIEWTGQFCR